MILTVRVVFWQRETMFLQTLVPAGVATQSTDFLSLVPRFCVQLLLNRGATFLSSFSTLKTEREG